MNNITVTSPEGVEVTLNLDVELLLKDHIVIGSPEPISNNPEVVLNTTEPTITLDPEPAVLPKPVLSTPSPYPFTPEAPVNVTPIEKEPSAGTKPIVSSPGSVDMEPKPAPLVLPDPVTSLPSPAPFIPEEPIEPEEPTAPDLTEPDIDEPIEPEAPTIPAPDTQYAFPEDWELKPAQSTPEKITVPKGLDNIADVKYIGAFRALAGGESSSNYANGQIAYNPSRHSLYLAGHNTEGAICEVAIPETLSFADSAKDVVKAEVLQNYAKAVLTGPGQGSAMRVNGMLWDDGKLLVNSTVWYDGSGRNKRDMQVFDADALANGSKGYLTVEGNALASGYLGVIPENLQDSFGGATHFMGSASNHSITSRYSQGPSFYTFDPKTISQPDREPLELSDTLMAYVNQEVSKLKPATPKDSQYVKNKRLKAERMALGRLRTLQRNYVTGVVPTDLIQSYPYSPGKELVPGGSSFDKVSQPRSPLWNSLASARYSFIVPDTEFLVVLGRISGVRSGIGYKIKRPDFGRPEACHGGCPFDPSDVNNSFLIYRISDMLSAENYWETRPVAYGSWSHPFDNKGKASVSGATFDHTTGNLYLSISGAGKVGQYDKPPLIIGYNIQAK